MWNGEPVSELPPNEAATDLIGDSMKLIEVAGQDAGKAVIGVGQGVKTGLDQLSVAGQGAGVAVIGVGQGVKAGLDQLSVAGQGAGEAVLIVGAKVGQKTVAGAKVGLEKTVEGAVVMQKNVGKVGRGALDMTRELVLLGDEAETDVAKLYGGLQRPSSTWRGCIPCGCDALVPAAAALMSMGRKTTLEERQASAFLGRSQSALSLGRTLSEPETGLRSIVMLNRLRRMAIRATPLTRDLRAFVGKWGVVRETGRAAYVQSLELPWMVRKVAVNMPTPPITFFLDEHATLHSQQGPLFGRMVVSLHPQRTTTTQEEFQGTVSEITSSWEDDDEGRPVLVCRTTTVGKQDVCDQRSRVDVEEGRLTVETRLVKRPGMVPIEYERVYEPMY